MSTDTIHQIAQNDTPAAVEVPNSLAGLLVWAAGRFGGGAVIGLLCLVGLNTVYQDMKETNRVLLTVVQENVKVNVQTVGALEAMRADIRDAHQRASRQ